MKDSERLGVKPRSGLRNALMFAGSSLQAAETAMAAVGPQSRRLELDGAFCYNSLLLQKNRKDI